MSKQEEKNSFTKKEKRSSLAKIWIARKQILEGLGNTIKPNAFVELVAAYRLKICDDCKYKGNDCLVIGTGPCCSACGCSLKLKVRSLSSACGLFEVGKQPKWFPVVTQNQEDEYFSNEI